MVSLNFELLVTIFKAILSCKFKFLSREFSHIVQSFDHWNILNISLRYGLACEDWLAARCPFYFTFSGSHKRNEISSVQNCIFHQLQNGPFNEGTAPPQQITFWSHTLFDPVREWQIPLIHSTFLSISLQYAFCKCFLSQRSY